jgi:[ribosomal protein S5]-alanine N-acetyltransferase
MIRLRSIHSVPAKEIQALADNKSIAENLKDGFPHPYFLKNAKDFLLYVQQGLLGHVFGIFQEDQFIGIGSILPQHDIYRMNGEIGYWIGEPYWGKGYGRQAVRVLTDYAFEEMKLIRVFASVFAQNKASMKVLEHAGYKLEAVFKSSIVKYDVMTDEYIFSILNPATT